MAILPYIVELNSVIGIVVCNAPEEFISQLRTVQNHLFDIGAELAMTGMTSDRPVMLAEEHVEQLEQELDRLNATLQPLQEFILPGGSKAASYCHLARSVCRRAERSLITLDCSQQVEPVLVSYINRLSDYLFVLARCFNHNQGTQEIYWNKQ